MKKVAIFGNAGGGKSTLARRLAQATGLPLHVLDLLQYRAGGGMVPREEYLAAHRELMAQHAWIIEGYGCPETLWQRLTQADTLIHVDLPLATHAWWVTKRLFKGLFVNPEGWPQGSPVWSSTLNSYKVLWLCHTRLTPKYRAFIAAAGNDKTVVSLRSAREIATFLAAAHRLSPDELQD